MRNEVYVIGGGPSLKNFNFFGLTHKDTIVTNKSILNVPLPSYFITVDYTFPKKIGLDNFKQVHTSKVFVADFSHPFLKEKDGRIVDTRHDMVYNLENFNVIIKSHKSEGIGYSLDDFRTGLNSGFCALQLAVILDYKKIYLLGMDLCVTNQTHYHSGYGEGSSSFKSKLDKYYDYFKAGLEQLKRERPDIQVVSCSPNSRLNTIVPYCLTEEMFK